MLHERHARKVRNLCIWITKDLLLADDYTQDIFLRVYHKLEQFEGRSSFSSWLYALAYHYCLGVLKRENRLPFVAMEDHHSHIAAEAEDENLSYRWSQVSRVLGTLSSEERHLLYLKYDESLGIEEIARHYNTTQGTIKMRLKRARDRVASNVNALAG